MKFAHIADTHIRNLKYHKEYREVFSQLYKNLREEKPWIDEEEDQSNYFWAHIELLRKNTAGSKSWYYDPDWLKIEAVHFKNLGVNKWHCLMKPGTTYIDAVNVQAEIRSSDDLFKTPVWSDVTFNSVVWKKLEFNI